MKKMICIFDILAVTFIFLSLCVGVTAARRKTEIRKWEEKRTK